MNEKQITKMELKTKNLDPVYLRARYMKVSKKIDILNEEVKTLTKEKNQLFNDYWVATHV